MTEDKSTELDKVGFAGTDPAKITDITKLRIDCTKSVEERRSQYLKQVGNPYLVRVGDTVVKVSFAKNGTSFEEAFENLLSMT